MTKLQICRKEKERHGLVCCVVCLRDDGVASGRLVRRRRAGPPGMCRSYWLQAVGPPRSHWLPALSPADRCNTAAPTGGGGERSRRRHHRRQRTFHRRLFTDHEKITGAAAAAAAVVQWEV